MKQKLDKLIRTFWDPVRSTAGMLPLIYWIFARFVPELLGYAWIFPALFGISLLISLHVPARRTGVCVAVEIAVFLVAAILIMPGQFKLSVLMAAFGTAAMLIIRMLENGASLSSYLSMAIHLLVQLQIASNRISGKTMLDSVVPVVTASFFVFLVLSLLTMNRDNLQDVTMGRHKVPGSMKRKQRRLTLLLIGGAFLIMMIPTVAQGIQNFFQWLLGIFLAVMEWMTSLFAGEESNDPPLSMDSMKDSLSQMANKEEVHNFEEVLVIVVMAALAVALVWFLVKMLLRLFRLIQRLWKKLGNGTTEEAQTYEDEITSTRETSLKEMLRNWSQRNKILSVDDRSLEPGKRIRYHYLRLLMKHHNWKNGKTARENLPEDVAALYEKARYSNHPISEAEAGKFVSEIRRL